MKKDYSAARAAKGTIQALFRDAWMDEWDEELSATTPSEDVAAYVWKYADKDGNEYAPMMGVWYAGDEMVTR